MRKKSLLLYFKKNNLNNSRLGISVSKKFGKAVRRNYFKRIIRDEFRKSQYKDDCFDILVVSNNRFFIRDQVITSKERLIVNSDFSKALEAISKYQ